MFFIAWYNKIEILYLFVGKAFDQCSDARSTTTTTTTANVFTTTTTAGHRTKQCAGS